MCTFSSAKILLQFIWNCWSVWRQKIFCRPFIVWLIDMGWWKWFIQTTRPHFIKAAKVPKASTQRMRLMKIDPTVIEDKLANQGVSWKFISERASHCGGRWEGVCQQLKELLRKVLGKAFLNYTEMMTVLTDINDIINSCSLNYLGDDIWDGRIIMPAL